MSGNIIIREECWRSISVNLNNNQSYNSFMSGLFFIFMLLIPFQDSGLSETPLRMFGLYLSNFPLAIMLLLSLLHCYITGKIKKEYIVLVSAGCYIIIYSLGIVIFRGDDLLLAIYKIITNGILLFFQIASFYYAIQYFPIIKRYIWIVFFVNLLGCLLCDVLSIDLGFLIHRRSLFDMDGRFHGFSSETSWFSYTTVILGCLSSVCTSSKYLKWGYLAISVIIAFLGGSKGVVACIPLAFVLYSLFATKRNIFVRFFLLVLTIIISVGIFDIFLSESFEYDLKESTSFSTRCSSILAGIIIFIHYPFGTGFGSFIPVMRETIIEAFDILNNYVPIFLLSSGEIMEMLADPTGSGLAVKSVFFQYLSFFGIPFLLFLYWLIKKAIRIFRGCKLFYVIVIYFIFISLATFAQFYYDSIIAMATLYMLRFYKNNNYNLQEKDSRQV